MKKEKEDFNTRIWPDILNFNIHLDSELIKKSNFIFGASTIILVFILNKLVAEGLFKNSFLLNLPFYILLTGTFISSLLSMLVILPKIRLFSKKERRRGDFFYYKNILKFYSREEYYQIIKSLPVNNKKTGRAYADQIYSLANNILPYKFKMLKYAGWTLIFTIFFAIISYLISFFIVSHI